MTKIRRKARETILKNYNLQELLNQHLHWIKTGELKKLSNRKSKKGFTN